MSSMRSSRVPPRARADSQASKNVRALPRCRTPVGLGADRPTAIDPDARSVLIESTLAPTPCQCQGTPAFYQARETDVNHAELARVERTRAEEQRRLLDELGAEAGTGVESGSGGDPEDGEAEPEPLVPHGRHLVQAPERPRQHRELGRRPELEPQVVDPGLPRPGVDLVVVHPRRPHEPVAERDHPEHVRERQPHPRAAQLQRGQVHRRERVGDREEQARHAPIVAAAEEN